jgi:NAD(P)-dependent dehydrogenase (short-subunit alcohol dehydrogenase family)
MERKAGSRVLITGGGDGIGFFIAQQLLEDEHRVAVLDLNAAKLGALEALAKCLNIEEAEAGVAFQILHPPLTRTVSSGPLPAEFMADPEKVGRALAKHLFDKGFIICHSFGQRLQTAMAYRFPIRLGKLMSRMTARTTQAHEK